MESRFEKGYALLVGVGKSIHADWSLPVTVKDAAAVKAVLTDVRYCGYPDDGRHVRLLTDEQATKANILAGLAELAEVTAQQKATVVVYYSGHGWLHREGGGRYYLVPHDTEAGDRLLDTALPAEQLIDALRKIDSSRLLVILDTC